MLQSIEIGDFKIMEEAAELLRSKAYRIRVIKTNTNSSHSFFLLLLLLLLLLGYSIS